MRIIEIDINLSNTEIHTLLEESKKEPENIRIVIEQLIKVVQSLKLMSSEEKNELKDLLINTDPSNQENVEFCHNLFDKNTLKISIDTHDENH